MSSLRSIHRAHLFHVPFENLDIHRGVPISLEIDRIVDKLVAQRRGGFCYELNGGFASLLASLGFEVALLEARVYSNGAVGIPFDHMLLRVDLDEPWLCDVGFGESFRAPLRLALGMEQPDFGRAYRVEESPDAGWLDLVEDGKPVFRFSLEPRALVDFAPGCAFHQSPGSHFLKNTVCSLPTDTGRITIRNQTLITTLGKDKTERELATDDELRMAYRDHFGVRLPELPPIPGID